MQRRTLQHLVLLLSIAFVSVSFQNCGTSQSTDIAGADNKGQGAVEMNCAVPWHPSLQVLDGKSVAAFASETVAEGETCQQEQRACVAGVLSGTFQFGACQVLPASAANCAVPWSESLVVESGKSTKAYSVAQDGTCGEEVRTCANGVLSGTFELAACPDVGAKSCELPNGEKLASGMTIKLKEDGQPFLDTDCGKFTQYTCKDDELTHEEKVIECPTEKGPCKLPWGDELSSGNTVSAYKNATAKDKESCEGPNKEVRACNDGKLSGSFENKACTVKEVKELICKIHFDGGASAATKVKTKEQCFSYLAQIKLNNPKLEIVKLTLDGKELEIPSNLKGNYVAYKIIGGQKSKIESKNGIQLVDARVACRAAYLKDESVSVECTFNGLLFQKYEAKAQECKVAFQGGGSIASQQVSEEKCKAYWAEVKKNNPQNEIAKVTFGAKVLYSGSDSSEKVCKAYFKSGGSAATKVQNKAGCEKYHEELKKNNPTNPIVKVTLDGKVIFEAKDEPVEPKKICKAIFKGGGSAATEVKDKADCEKYHEELKKNNPTNPIVKVTLDGKVIFEANEKPVSPPKVCKVTFKSGASAATKVESKADCVAYGKEIKMNNPGQAIKSITYDGKPL